MTDSTNVTPYPGNPRGAAGDGGDGGGFDTRPRALEIHVARVEERVAAIQAAMATKADIEAVKTLIADRDAKQQRWLLGILAGAAIAVTIALLRTFMD